MFAGLGTAGSGCDLRGVWITQPRGSQEDEQGVFPSGSCPSCLAPRGRVLRFPYADCSKLFWWYMVLEEGGKGMIKIKLQICI